jgi:hypothetical protein
LKNFIISDTGHFGGETILSLLPPPSSPLPPLSSLLSSSLLLPENIYLFFQVRDILVADSTLSVLEIWTAEYQEADALLLRPEHQNLFSEICVREKCPVAFVGTVTGDGRIVLYDATDESTPVNLSLEQVKIIIINFKFYFFTF